MTKKVLILLVLYVFTYTPALWAKKEKTETNPYIASTQKTKIAVYIEDMTWGSGKLNYGHVNSLEGYVREGLAKSNKYIVINRSDALNSVIQQVLENQRNGHIDYSQITSATKQYGEIQVCAIEVTYDEPKYQEGCCEFRASVLDVERNIIINTASYRKCGFSYHKRINFSNIEEASKKLIADLLGNKSSKGGNGKSYVAWALAGGGFPWNATSGISSRFGGAVGIGFYGDVGMDFTRITVDYSYKPYYDNERYSGYDHITRGTFRYAGGIKFFPYNGLYLACGYGSIVKPFANVEYDGDPPNSDDSEYKDYKIDIRKKVPSPTHGLLLHIGYDVVHTYSYEKNGYAFFLSINGGVSYDMTTKEYMPSVNLKVGIAWNTRK